MSSVFIVALSSKIDSSITEGRPRPTSAKLVVGGDGWEGRSLGAAALTLVVRGQDQAVDHEAARDEDPADEHTGEQAPHGDACTRVGHVRDGRPGDVDGQDQRDHVGQRVDHVDPTRAADRQCRCFNEHLCLQGVGSVSDLLRMITL